MFITCSASSPPQGIFSKMALPGMEPGDTLTAPRGQAWHQLPEREALKGQPGNATCFFLTDALRPPFLCPYPLAWWQPCPLPLVAAPSSVVTWIYLPLRRAVGKLPRGMGFFFPPVSHGRMLHSFKSHLQMGAASSQELI